MHDMLNCILFFAVCITFPWFGCLSSRCELMFSTVSERCTSSRAIYCRNIVKMYFRHAKGARLSYEYVCCHSA